MKLIGIGGSGPGAGKDTFANFIKEHAESKGQEVLIFGFGDLIRRDLAQAFSSVLDVPHTKSLEWMSSPETKEQSRTIQQEWPVIARYFTGNTDYLISKWKYIIGELATKENLLVLNPSVRRESESKMIQDLGGTVVYIQGDSKRSLSENSINHECENAFSPDFCDIVIENDSNIESLRQKAIKFYEESVM